MRRRTPIRLGRLMVPMMLIAAACAAPDATGSDAGGPTTPPPVPGSFAAATPAVTDGDIRHVGITIATGNDVMVEITDSSGLLRDATAGDTGDGASVEPYELAVTNDDPSTLRLTWTGGPCDASASLAIDDAVRSVRLVEPECPGDAVAYDRVLLLHLTAPVDAAGVHAVVQDGVDTAD